MTISEKVVPWLNKHDDAIEWKFMTIAPKWKAACVPGLNTQLPAQIISQPAPAVSTTRTRPARKAVGCPHLPRKCGYPQPTRI